MLGRVCNQLNGRRMERHRPGPTTLAAALVRSKILGAFGSKNGSSLGSGVLAQAVAAAPDLAQTPDRCHSCQPSTETIGCGERSCEGRDLRCSAHPIAQDDRR